MGKKEKKFYKEEKPDKEEKNLWIIAVNKEKTQKNILIVLIAAVLIVAIFGIYSFSKTNVTGNVAWPVDANRQFLSAKFSCANGGSTNQLTSKNCKSAAYWRNFADKFCRNLCEPTDDMALDNLNVGTDHSCDVASLNLYQECQGDELINVSSGTIPVGEDCSADAECVYAAFCEGAPYGTCQYSQNVGVGGACAQDSQCIASTFCQNAPQGTCALKINVPVGESCIESSQCVRGAYCGSGVCTLSTNVPPGGACMLNTQCQSGSFCILENQGGTCMTPSFGVSTCASDSDCASFGDYFCSQVFPWSITKWCVPKVGGPCVGDQACYQSSTTTKQVESYQENANLISTIGPWTNSNLIYDGNWDSYGFSPYYSLNTYIQMAYNKPENLNSVKWQVKDQSRGVRNLTLPSSCLNAYSDKIVMRVMQYGGGSYLGYWQCDSGGGSFTNLATFNGYIYEEAVIWNKNETESGGSSTICIGWPFYGKTGFPVGACKTGYKGTFSCERTLSAVPAECYQEIATVPNQKGTDTPNCGLNYSSPSTWSDGWDPPVIVFDGDWDTFSDVALRESEPRSSFGDLYSFYVSPENAVGAKWKVKYKLRYLDNTEEIITENLSIPEDCLNVNYPYPSIPGIAVGIAVEVWFPFNATSGGSPGISFFSCMNKTDIPGQKGGINRVYLRTYNFSGPGAIINASFYEEAMIWDVVSPSLHVQGSYLQAGSNEVKTIDSYVPIDSSLICTGNLTNVTEKNSCGYYLWKLNSIPSMEWILNKGNFNNIELKQEEEFSAEQFKVSPGETVQTCLDRWQECYGLMPEEDAYCREKVAGGCSDTDRSESETQKYINYLLAGTVTYVNESGKVVAKYDGCNGNVLTEYYCSQIGGSEYWTMGQTSVNCNYLGGNGVCQSGACSCTPNTCASLGKQCRTWPNGCSGTLICGNAIGDCVNPLEACTNSGQCIPIPVPDMAWWKLNGNGLDSVSTNNLLGIGPNIINTSDRFNVANSALYFNGLNINVGLVNTSATNSFPSGNSSRTITAWVKTDRQYRMGIFGYGTGQGFQNRWHMYLDNSGKLAMGIPWTQGDGTFRNDYDVVDSNGNNIADGNWHFVAGTLMGENSRHVKLYVGDKNGNFGLVEEGDITYNINTILSPFYAIAIGKFNTAQTLTSSSFNGSIDDVMVFNRALTDDEVSALYDSSKP